ncbi:MAG: nitroreductase [Planctomycetes bacterium]|nr:nitroreductase [Planctomycetota bacterium]
MNVLEAIKNRRSVRAYTDRPLPPEVFQKLCDALRFAPSACNYQPWQFILVQDPDLRAQVAQVCKKQTWMADAPLIVVACGSPEQAYKGMGGSKNSVEIDIAIALDHLSLVAVAEGLGTCWIGAFDEQSVSKLLNIPTEQYPVALMPVGYPKHADSNSPISDDKRKASQEIFIVNAM